MAYAQKEIIANAKKMMKDGYVYVYGYKGSVVTEKGVRALAKQYPSVFTPKILNLALKKVGKYGIDCSGFVNKAAGTSLGGSSQIHASSPKSWSTKDLSYIENAMYVWRSGHIGLIEIDSKGVAWILEAQSTASDLKRTKLSSRIGGFTHYGKIKGVKYVPKKKAKTYSGLFPTLPSKGYLAVGDSGTQVKRLQKFLNWYGGYGLVVDGEFGAKTSIALADFQAKQYLIADSEFGKKSLAMAKTVKK